MSHSLTIRLDDATFAAIVREAEAKKSTPDAVVAETVERSFGGANGKERALDPEQAREAFNRLIGAASLGYPIGIDNESIDADLAREYGDNHEEP